MMVPKKTFTVTVARKEVVAATMPAVEHWLPLSNLDLLMPPLDASMFYCYKKPDDVVHDQEAELSKTFAHKVGILKEALAKVLVPFYVLGGEIVCSAAGEPELLCNNHGVEFTEAYADVRLCELNLYDPDDSIGGKLVPGRTQGVLSVQATELKCGGMVIGCTFDHRVADAYSANMFLVAWAETAASKPLSIAPSFRRSLISPRRPGYYEPSHDDFYIPVKAASIPEESPDDPITSRIYYVPANQLDQLQASANSNAIDGTCRRTKLESFGAFLWKIVAKHTCNEVNDLDIGDKMCRMGVVVDGRTRLGDGGNGLKEELTARYFGNVVSIPYGRKSTRELIEKPLSWVAEKVHEFLKCAVTKEHFQGLIDWVEAHRPEPAMVRVYSSNKDDGPAFVLSSGRGFMLAKVDFGWGKPVFGSCHFPWGGTCGYVMPMFCPNGNGDWIVYMHLSKGQLDYIESEAPHLFKRFSLDVIS
ncbi:hypothetical protein Ancab_033918 [Ancistrocladus abbreviatus]